ncbi:MAG: ribosome maturation factor RimP [Pseudomonadota bacterium]
MTPLEDTLVSLISPVVDDEGFELVRVRVTGAKQKTIQVMAERADKTMSAEDCARLSRALSPVLEAADPIEGAYTLEVSSPGIDRPLTRFSDFDDWVGYDAKLELDRLVEGRKRFRGVLAGTDDGNVCIDIEGEDETALVPDDGVMSAKLVLTDQLMRESLAAAKAAEAAADPGDQSEDARENFSEMEKTHDTH